MTIIGLTGSIGMGKSTTAAIFRAAGVPVHDADAAVHGLYAGAAVASLEAEFPGVSVDGRIDRGRLAEKLVGDPAKLARLEAIVHPLVRQQESAFLQQHAGRHAVLVLDIPLLLEVGGAARVDVVLVVSASTEVQRARVLARPGMTEEKFATLRARQMPDEEKRRRAHVVIDTGRGTFYAERCVTALLRALR